MTTLRKDAINLLEQIPEDKLYFVVQIMQGINGLYGTTDQIRKDRAFEELERLRRKDVSFDYDKELESYREEKYGVTNTN